MKKIIEKIGILCASVIIMLMASVLIVIVHIAKFIRKFGYERNPFRRSHQSS
ncbi:MAG: hypothetical protein KAJ70_00515 [Candidatus Omnitrophica bacterium]|nr:hypothetical protein [Candidatus Omnitrophota bacterium]